MISDVELARQLYPKAADIAKEAGIAQRVTAVYGTALEPSADGSVTVVLDGYAGGVDAAIDVPTAGGISEGDQVVVYLDGGAPVDAAGRASVDAAVMRITQTSHDLTLSFQSYYEQVDGTFAELVETDAETADALDTLRTQVDEDAALRESFIRFGSDSGTPYMEMGESSSAKNMKLTSGSLEFRDGTETVGAIIDGTMTMQNAVIEQTLRFGGFAWIPRANGNLTLKWVGDSE